MRTPTKSTGAGKGPERRKGENTKLVRDRWPDMRKKPTKCPNDTDGDGDCHLCRKNRKCLHL